MVTKEECEALRKHLSILDDCPLPWSSDGDFQGEIECANGYIVTTCEQDNEAEFIAAVVNVFPALLDALEDAGRALATAHARMELETEQGELHRELARLRGQLAAAREDASEMEKKAIAEGSEALALRAEVAALKASTTIIHVDESLRMSMEREIASLKRRIANLEADSACAERALIVARDAVLEFGNRPDHWAGPLLTKHIAAALIERAAFELGAIEASDCHHFKPESEK